MRCDIVGLQNILQCTYRCQLCQALVLDIEREYHLQASINKSHEEGRDFTVLKVFTLETVLPMQKG